MKGPIAAGLLALASTVSAQYSQACQSGVCYALNIPDETAKSGSGDIYLQISGPTSMSWIAIGQGTQMSGANMFIIYTDGSGKNVTVSPRTASGHNTPSYKSDTSFEVLEGTGVSNGKMVANLKCSSCGDKAFTSSAGDWIWAYKSGSALDSSDKDAAIAQHSEYNTGLKFDYSKAQVGTNSNPFANSSSTSSSGSGTNCNGAAAQSSGSATTTSSSGYSGPFNGAWGGPSHPTGPPSKRQTTDDGCENTANSFGSNSGASTSSQTQMLIAHGVLACLAFVILFPMGAIAIRLLNFPGLLMLHAAIQIFAYLVFIIAFGLGVYIANDQDLINEYHPVIGIVLFILIFFQPILGVLHHSAYKKYQRRTLWSHGHLWLGRIIITLGIINGGLGFLLADNSPSGAIAYGVIAAIVWLAYVVSVVIGERRRAKGMEAPPKYEEVLPRNSERHPEGNDVPMEYYSNRHPVAQ